MPTESAAIDRCTNDQAHFDVAKVAAKYLGNRIIYCQEHWYWFVQNKHGWVVSKEARELRMELSETISPLFKERAKFWQEKANDATDDTEKDMQKKRSQQLMAISMALKSAKYKDSVIKECKGCMYNEDIIKKMDSYTHLLRCPNGVYDFKQHVFRDGRPEDYCSLNTLCPYVPFSEDMQYLDDFKYYMSQVFQNAELREYALRVLASTLDKTFKLERFYIFTGSGSNSKSIFCKAIQNCIGEYACILPVACITQKRVSANSAQSEIERTKGRRVALLQEPEGIENINCGYMKELSGGDSILARGLYKEPIEFMPQFTMIMTCNELPKVTSDDQGTWRRIRAVPFLSKFMDNPKKKNEFPLDGKIEDKLKNVWRSTIMSYLIHICENMPRDVRGHRYIPEPEIVLEQTSKYKYANDPIAQYMQERITTVDERRIPLKINTIYIDYKSWSYKNTTSYSSAMKRIDFEKKFEKKLIEMEKTLLTIAIVEDNDDEDDEEEPQTTEDKVKQWFNTHFQIVENTEYVPISTTVIADYFVTNVLKDKDKKGKDVKGLNNTVTKAIATSANAKSMVIKSDMVRIDDKRTCMKRLHYATCAIEALKHM